MQNNAHRDLAGLENAALRQSGFSVNFGALPDSGHDQLLFRTLRIALLCALPLLITTLF